MKQNGSIKVDLIKKQGLTAWGAQVCTGDMDSLLSKLLEMELATDAETNKKAIQQAFREGLHFREEILNRAAVLLLDWQQADVLA